MALLRPFSAAALCANLFVGCTVERGVGRFPSLDMLVTTSDAGATAADAGARGNKIEDAAGFWVLYTQDRICIDAGVGEPVDNLIWSAYLVEIEDTGSALLNQKIRLCRQTLSPLPFGFVTIVPERVTNALPTYDVSGFFVGREQGQSYLTEPFVDLWGGADLPLDTPLPTDIDDPRVIDVDEDGKPGVTLTVTSPDGNPICEVTVVQRTEIQLNGTIVDGQHVQGEYQAAQDKVVLTASSPLCGGGDILPNFGRKFSPSSAWTGLAVALAWTEMMTAALIATKSILVMRWYSMSLR